MEERQSLSVQPHEIGDLEAVKKAKSVEKIKRATICAWQLSAETSVIPELLRVSYTTVKYTK